MELHPSTQALLDSFKHYDLPYRVRNRIDQTRQAYADMAKAVTLYTPEGPELIVALRKLRESKDAAVHAIIAAHRQEGSN